MYAVRSFRIIPFGRKQKPLKLPFVEDVFTSLPPSYKHLHDTTLSRVEYYFGKKKSTTKVSHIINREDLGDKFGELGQFRKVIFYSMCDSCTAKCIHVILKKIMSNRFPSDGVPAHCTMIKFCRKFFRKKCSCPKNLIKLPPPTLQFISKFEMVLDFFTPGVVNVIEGTLAFAVMKKWIKSWCWCGQCFYSGRILFRTRWASRTERIHQNAFMMRTILLDIVYLPQWQIVFVNMCTGCIYSICCMLLDVALDVKKKNFMASKYFPPIGEKKAENLYARVTDSVSESEEYWGKILWFIMRDICRAFPFTILSN